MNIELRGISKRFGPVRANQDIDLQIRAGEVLGLLGENGAGKSTLMNILSGLYSQDSGEILIDGEPAASVAGEWWPIADLGTAGLPTLFARAADRLKGAGE